MEASKIVFDSCANASRSRVSGSSVKGNNGPRVVAWQDYRNITRIHIGLDPSARLTLARSETTYPT